MKKKSRSFRTYLREKLKDPVFAAAYLNEHATYEGPRKMFYLLDAIREVGRAHGLTRVSRRAGVSRRTLYKAFSEKGNPSLETVLAVLKTVGVAIRFDARKQKTTLL
jgi:probable addiction module antidote protein